MDKYRRRKQQPPTPTGVCNRLKPHKATYARANEEGFILAKRTPKNDG